MSATTDSPNGGRYIGRGLPRPGAKRLLAGRGRYTDDVVLPRMLHAAFLRSPYAHARLGAIDVSEAAAMPGVHRVLTGKDFAAICTPWIGTLSHFKGMRSAPQLPLPLDKVVWAGQPVVMVVAESRAEAEDALEAIQVAFEELEAVVDLDAARGAQAPVSTRTHPTTSCSAPASSRARPRPPSRERKASRWICASAGTRR